MLLLTLRPVNKPRNFLIREQAFNSIEVPPQFLFAWNQLVYRFVAVTTDGNGLAHLLARESLAKPAI